MSGGTPPKMETKYWGGNIPWISAKSMIGNKYFDSDLKLTEEGLKKGSKLAPIDSVLLLVRGSMLHQKIPVGIVTKPVAFNQDVKAIIPSRDFSPLYFLYCFEGRSQELLNKVENTGIGAGKLDTDVLNKMEFYCPPLSEQKAIAHTLGSLDDKIELNRQMNATLEAMAQALFKSWFVDFDPVIDNALAAGNPIPDELEAKAAARQALGDARKPLPEDIRSLFPNAFVFTEEMGWIPEGWEISSLKDVSLVKGGYAFKSKDFTFSGSPVIKIKNINSDRTVDINDVQYIPDSIANKAKSFWLHTGDLLMAMTGATVGKFGLLTTIKDEHYLLNQRVAKFFPLTNLSKKIWFVYCCLNQEITTDYITNIAHGSAQPNISGDAIMTAKIIFPTSNLIRLFDENVDSIFSKMLKNNQQAYSLIQLRDTLLPKLLSGELRIPEAERLVVEAIA